MNIREICGLVTALRALVLPHSFRMRIHEKTSSPYSADDRYPHSFSQVQGEPGGTRTGDEEGNAQLPGLYQDFRGYPAGGE